MKNKEVVKPNSGKTATFLNKISIIPKPNKTNNGYIQFEDFLFDFLFKIKKIAEKPIINPKILRLVKFSLNK